MQARELSIKRARAHDYKDLSTSLTSSSDSEHEEGELSREGEVEGDTQPLDRLFPLEPYPKMLHKATLALELENSADEGAKGDKPSRVKQSNKLFPQRPSKPETAPFPKECQRVLDAEWARPTLPKRKSKILNKLYILPDSVTQALSVPAVVSLVVALSSAAVIPSDGEGRSKDAMDKRVENFLKRNFETLKVSLKDT